MYVVSEQHVKHAQQIIIQLQEDVPNVQIKDVQLVEFQMENVPLVSVEDIYQVRNAKHVPVKCQIVPPVLPMDQHVLLVQQIIIDQQRQHVHYVHQYPNVLHVQIMQTNVQNVTMDSIQVEHHVKLVTQ